ncbi:ParA family protein [Oceanisphaera sp. IT1-181]|uniref:ParA family protein n=1 Tax=Oceanisphaera sp. IT1-181 TaxID=3081199 RepID=UPI0029CA8E6B|nr:ParA family protein [Oceanisphaera sp. IT1-181]
MANPQITKARDTLRNLEILATVAESMAKRRRSGLADGGDAPNGKEYRRYNQAEALEDLQINTRTLNKRCSELGIDPKDGGYRWSITLPELMKLRKVIFHDQLIVRPDNAKPLVIAISNLKGGSGKTQTAVMASTGMATQLKSGYRVALIDCDPQGTGTMYLAPSFDADNELTFGDLMTEGYELQPGQTFNDVCKAAFKKTNIPNLDLLPADVNDNYIELYLQEQTSTQGSDFNPYDKLRKVVDAVEDQYDIIFIDTGPSIDFKVMNALYAANACIIPVQAQQNDEDATSKYLGSLHRIYARLEAAGHPGWAFTKLLISRLNRRSSSELTTASRFRASFDVFMMGSDLISSEAIKFCSTQLASIYEFSASEYPKGRVSLKTVQSETEAFLNELENLLLRYWGITDFSLHGIKN